MIPILFNQDATSFATHGIGDLMETLRCESIVNSEGEYELELEYPADGELIGSLTYNNIIVAKVNDHGAYQAFRIYGIDKAVNRLVTVHAQHLSYDLSCVVVKNFESTTCSGAMAGLKSHAIGSLANPFTFYTDVPNTERAQNQDKEFKMEEPLTLRAALLDGDDSIYGCWEGDLVFDNYTVKFLKPGSSDVDAGRDRGVLIEYGIDMIDMEEEQNISEMVTGVYPYWKGREDGEEGDSGIQDEFFVYGDVQYAAGTFARHRVIPLNVSEYYPNNTKAPSKAEINATAREWMTANKVGEPIINLTVSYAELGKDVRLYDAITVRFVKIGIDYGAKVISYRYDVLKERCIEVEVGNVKPSILFRLEDASRLKRGLIPPKRIANNSIDSSKLENGSVGSSQLASQGVSDWHLKDSAVNNRSLADASVSTEKVQDWAIETTKIGDAAITTAKIKNGAVTTGKITDGAVVTGKIGDGAVVEAKIGNSAITSVKIKDGEVIESKIHDAAITTQKVADLAIDSAKIGNSAITSVKIKDGEVVEGKIGNQAVSFDKVKDANIDQLKLNDFSITSTKIADGDWAYNYATGQWERRNAAVGTYALQNYAVVEAKIGNYEVATVKLVQTAQDAIAAVWEIDTLVSNNIDSKGINSSYANIGYGLIGTINSDYVVTDGISVGGTYFSDSAVIDGYTVLCR